MNARIFARTTCQAGSFARTKWLTLSSSISRAIADERVW
jgi:hypothetical protein